MKFLVVTLMLIHVFIVLGHDFLEANLQTACRSGDVKQAEKLIQQGANIDWQNSYGWTALMFASDAGHWSIVDLLGNSGANFDLRENDGWSALFFAAHNGDRRTVDYLLKYGADATLGTEKKLFAHNIAGVQGHRELSNYIALTAGKQAEEKKDIHPLHATYWKQTSEMVQLASKITKFGAPYDPDWVARNHNPQGKKNDEL